MKKSLSYLLVALIILVALITSACQTDIPDPTEPHVHSFGEWETVTAPSCTESGLQVRTCACGEEEQAEIKATGHTEVVVAGTDATCTAAGLTEGKSCSVCGTVTVAQEAIPAKGHTEVVDKAVDATCTATGLTEGKHCSVCNAVLIEQTIVPMKAHTEGEWIIDKDASCTETGSKHQECTICYTTLKAESIPAAHTEGEWTVNADKTKLQLFCVVCDEVLGEKESSEGLRFKLNDDGESYSVTGIGTCTDKCILIPAVHNGFPVTSIGYSAFEYYDTLTSITIPDSVTEIGNYAFYSCTNLTSVTIPDSVTKIGWYAFRYCHGLTSITIPDSVTEISGGAFSYCYGLTSITIPDSVTKIGSYAFSGCTGLTSITIPDSVTSIGEEAFYGCSGLTSITIPDSVAEIGIWAFCDCTGLTSITIPDSVTYIGSSAFLDCTGLMSITVGTGNNHYSSDKNGVLFNKDKTVLLQAPGAISGEYIIPDSVTEIHGCAFYYCSGLTSITIPDSVAKIGGNALNGCTGLTSITIPDSVTYIDWYAFRNCTGLMSITVGTGNNHYSSDKNGVLFNKDKTVLLQAPSAISGEYIIPDSVTSIYDSAFEGCTGLTSITIPDSVTSIDDSAFEGCTSLKKLIIADGSKTVTEAMVICESQLTEIVIPDSVTEIGDRAFEGCTGLTSILFDGTVSQWKAIRTGTKWNDSTGTYSISCTDGTIAKNGTVTYN